MKMPHRLLLAAVCWGVAVPSAAAPGEVHRPGKKAAASKAEDPSVRVTELMVNADFERLISDAPYATEMLAKTEGLAPQVAGDPVLSDQLERFRSVALAGAGRSGEALDRLQQNLLRSPDDPSGYHIVIALAVLTERPSAAVEALELAAKALGADERAPFADALDPLLLSRISQAYRQKKDDQGVRRFAEAVLAVGWPTVENASSGDWYRMDAIEGRLARGDTAGARALAAEIAGPRELLRVLIAKRYEAARDPAADPAAAIARAVAEEDRRTAARLAEAPDDWEALTARATLLRQAGRPAEAVKLIEPKIADMKRVAEGGEYAFWAVNEAAYALEESGRPQEAVALLDRLLELPLEKHPDLISMAINRIEMITAAGRPAEAAAEATGLAGLDPRFASAYGKMWIYSGAACGHALSGNRAAAAEWVAKLEAGSADNQAAHLRGLLCTGDLDAAEKVLVARLSGDGQADALVGFQEYTLGAVEMATGPITRTVAALTERPAVKAAIAAAGRIVRVPLSRAYFAGF